MKRIIFEIFRTGQHNGKGRANSLIWTNEHLHEIATFYSEQIKSAPLVLNHPENDYPTYGQVKRIIHKDGALFAEVEAKPELVQKIKNGQIRGISVSLFMPNSIGNPIKKLGHYLKHVGFLENDNPAVKGMLPPEESIRHLSFSELSQDCVSFCELNPTQSTVEQIHAQACYFQNALNTDYKTAFNMVIHHKE